MQVESVDDFDFQGKLNRRNIAWQPALSPEKSGSYQSRYNSSNELDMHAENDYSVGKGEVLNLENCSVLTPSTDSEDQDTGLPMLNGEAPNDQFLNLASIHQCYV